MAAAILTTLAETSAWIFFTATWSTVVWKNTVRPPSLLTFMYLDSIFKKKKQKERKRENYLTDAETGPQTRQSRPQPDHDHVVRPEKSWVWTNICKRPRTEGALEKTRPKLLREVRHWWCHTENSNSNEWQLKLLLQGFTGWFKSFSHLIKKTKPNTSVVPHRYVCWELERKKTAQC